MKPIIEAVLGTAFIVAFSALMGYAIVGFLTPDDHYDHEAAEACYLSQGYDCGANSIEIED